MHGKGLSVFGSLDIQSAVFLHSDIAGVNQVAVICSGVRIIETVPAVDDVIGIQIFAVRPLQTVSEGEDIGQAVFGNFRFFLGKFRNQLSFRVIGVQAGESEDCQASLENELK